MSASFPTSVKAFTTKVDGAGQTINAAHVNDLQDEVTAVESSLVNGVARCQVYNSAAQSIPNSAFTALTFDTEDHDTGGMHSTSANTSRITVPSGAGGLYLLTAAVFFVANATGQRVIRITKNGATQISPSAIGYGNATYGSAIQTSCFVSLSAGDYVEAEVIQDSGGALNAGSASRYLTNQFYAVRVW